MKLLIMAWRNVFRHTRRSLITALAISVGLSGMIAIDTLMNGVDKASGRNITAFETGQLEVFAKGYYREEGVLPLDTVITDPERVMVLVENVPGVEGVTSRLKFPARLNNGVDELLVVAIGIDLESEGEVFATRQAVIKGEFILDGTECLIGADLVQDMKSDVGSLLTLICRDKNGTYNAYDFTVVGLLSTTHPLIDRNAVLMELTAVQELMAMPGQVTEICIKTDDNQGKIVALKKEIQDKLGNEYEVYDWTELNAALFRIMGIKRTFGILIAIVVLVIAAVGIINTMLMAVIERIPEIGMLKAFGFANDKILKLFLYEGAIIGAFGSLIGSCLGVLVSVYLVTVGLDYSHQFKNAVMNMPMKWIFKGELNMTYVIYVFIFGVLVSLLVTLVPVRRAVKLQPVDALRHV